MPKAAPLAIVSTLPVIIGCALLGASEASATPYVVTIAPVGTDVVATSNAGGEFDLDGLELLETASEQAQIWPTRTSISPKLVVSTGAVDIYGLAGSGAIPGSFGPGLIQVFANSSSGPSTGVARSAVTDLTLDVPPGYTSGTPLPVSEAIWNNATIASLGLAPEGNFLFQWGSGLPDQSFEINVVPGPIVGAGLPGLIAALGGLVAMARRRRKQLA